MVLAILMGITAHFLDDKKELNFFEKTIKDSVTFVEKIFYAPIGFVKEKVEMFTETKDLYASIDKNMDILTGQIRKAKTIKEKQMKDASIKDMFVSAPETNIENEVVKTTYYDIKPMTIEDAQIKLEEQGNIFLPFINVETSKVNVIYKLKDGKNFGISEPEN